jgi:hypothetical protein
MNIDAPLQQWLTASFPERPGWVIRERLPLGSFQQSMERLTLEWPGVGAREEIFVRVYRSYMSWWTLIAPDLPQRERSAWQVATQAGIPVPDVLYASCNPDVTIFRRAPGAPGQQPATMEAIENIAEMLARLHRAKIVEQDAAHLPDVSTKALLMRLALWAEEAESASLRREVDAMAAQLTQAEERPAGFLHGDWHGGNFLLEGDRVTAVLDWEEAALGDPRLDVANMHASLLRHSEELASRFRGAYEARAGFQLGPLRIWLELTNLRSRIMSAWVEHCLAYGRPLPSADPTVWIKRPKESAHTVAQAQEQ